MFQEEVRRVSRLARGHARDDCYCRRVVETVETPDPETPDDPPDATHVTSIEVRRVSPEGTLVTWSGGTETRWTGA